MDVRKELSFCAMTQLRVLGVVENMAGVNLPLSSANFVGPSGADETEKAKAMIAERCGDRRHLLRDIRLGVLEITWT